MYVVMEMQNGNAEGRVWPFETREDAEVKMYYVLAEAVKSNIPVHTIMLMTDEGFVLDTRCYKHDANA